MRTRKTHFLGMTMTVQCDFEPADPGNRECPPTDESMDIGEIFGPDGTTPILLNDLQVERLEEQLLAEMHAEADYNAYCDRS